MFLICLLRDVKYYMSGNLLLLCLQWWNSNGEVVGWSNNEKPISQISNPTGNISLYPLLKNLKGVCKTVFSSLSQNVWFRNHLILDQDNLPRHFLIHLDRKAVCILMNGLVRASCSTWAVPVFLTNLLFLWLLTILKSQTEGSMG